MTKGRLSAFFVRWKLDYAAVFLAASALFGLLRRAPYFSDPDSFYHIKMALLTAAHGPVREFPWLPFTVLAQSFADHHFLYHLLLAPFVLILGDFLGMQVACVVFGAAVITGFYALLRTYGVRAPWFYVAVLATARGSLFRLLLPKANALSILVLFLALIFMKRGRRDALFVLSFLFVWLYGGWPLLLVITGAFWLARLIMESFFPKRRLSWRVLTDAVAAVSAWLKRRPVVSHGLLDWPETRNVATAVAGLTAGLVINPFFPANLRFYWEQIFQVAVLNYRNVIGVGSEWYSIALPEFFFRLSVPLILIAAALILLVAVSRWGESRPRPEVTRERVTTLLAALILAVLFVLMALRSQRHMEYAGPFLTLFGALFIDSIVPNLKLGRFPPPGSPSRRLWAAIWIIGLYLAVVFPVLAMRDTYNVLIGNSKNFGWDTYAAAGQWLRANLPAGAVVMHTDWDEFPILMYYADQGRYIGGLDPTFLYRRDPARYWQWVDITLSRRRTGLADIARRSFGASYFFVAANRIQLVADLRADGGFREVYGDDQALIFAVNPPSAGH